MECRHVIKVHFGPVVCGPIGPKGAKRFDVYGQTVNIAAMTDSTGVAFTPQAFRKLLKKHAPPVTYIPVGQAHR